jgi:AhpC/TSA family
MISPRALLFALAIAALIPVAALIPIASKAQIPPMPGQPIAPAQAAPLPAQTLPDFYFTLPGNTLFTNKDLPRQKKLFFMLFDPTCPHCQMAMMRIEKQYRSFGSAAVYLVSMEDWDKINGFLASFAPTLRKQKNVTILQDKPGLLIARFKPHKFPAMFLYSADKKLIDYEDNEATVFRFVNAIGNK